MNSWYSLNLQFHNNVYEMETNAKQEFSWSHDILFHCACNLYFSCRVRDHVLVTQTMKNVNVLYSFLGNLNSLYLTLALQ